MRDTIVALSSGRPPAAIAVIRTSGPDAHAAAEQLGGPLAPCRQATLRTLRHPVSALEIDTALVLRFDGPHSVTGQDIVEYQCHGGRATVAAMLDALTSIPGLRLAEPGEFTRRALANGRIDLTEAEGLADLLEAETESQRRAALKLVNGALTRQIDQWQDRIISLSAQAEAAIDYVGDEDETGSDGTVLRTACTELAAELRAWLDRPRAERLKEGVRVVIAGPPNAGKSSLANALSGCDRAIVTAIPGTTRDSIEIPIAIDGVPVILVDTAGLRKTTDSIELLGIERAHSEAQRADLILWLGETGDAPAHPNILPIRSKSDVCPFNPDALLNVSAVTSEGMAALLSLMRKEASKLLPREDEVPLNRRQHALLSDAWGVLDQPPLDILMLAESLRWARSYFDRITGRAGVEETLDALFGRFCLGK